MATLISMRRWTFHFVLVAAVLACGNTSQQSSASSGSGGATQAGAGASSGVGSGSGGSVGAAGGAGSAGGPGTGGSGGPSGGAGSQDAAAGGLDGAGIDGSNADASCVRDVIDLLSPPTDVFVMIDTSGSMQCPAADDMCELAPPTPMRPTRWDAVMNAINGFVNAPASAGIAVGIGLFPISPTICTAMDYAQPVVAIAALPGNAQRVSNALAMVAPAGNTPTVPALTGAINYAKTYMTATPTRSAAVVLVTDGLPNGCSSTIAAASMVAMNAFVATPSITTYVVGLGNTASLDQIALAGSGNTRHYFPATGDVGAKLLAALREATNASSCDYALPMRPFDPNLVTLQITLGPNGTPQNVRKVQNSAACGAAGGWYYDDPVLPAKATLCPQSCDPVKTTEGSRIRFIIGCSGP